MTGLLRASLESDGGLRFQHREFRGPDGGPLGNPTALAASETAALLLTCGPVQCGAYVGHFSDAGLERVTAGNFHAGTERGLVWVGSSHRVDAIGPTGNVGGVVLPGGVDFSEPSRIARNAVPLIGLPGGTVAAPRMVGSDVVLEFFESGSEFDSVSSVSSDHAFAWSKDGTRLKVVAR